MKADISAFVIVAFCLHRLRNTRERRNRAGDSARAWYAMDSWCSRWSCSRAVAAAFADPAPVHRYGWFLNNDRLGEAVLRATLVLSDKARDPGDITDALALLRSIGLEDLARRSALQLLLLTSAPSQ